MSLKHIDWPRVKNQEQKLQQKFNLHNQNDTEKLGRFLGENARPGDIICLNGDLGAGKTTLTQAIARGLKVPEKYYVTSPSFSLFHEYPGAIPLYHFDFYRLGSVEEIELLGFEEFFYLSGLTVIEWSQRAEEILPDERLEIYLQVEENEERIVHCKYLASRWKERMAMLTHVMGVQQDLI